MNITSKPDTSNTRVGRGKRKQNLPEISGIVPLEEKSNENEVKENDLIDKDVKNSHAESTTNDLELLKLSNINNDTNRAEGRITRFGRRLAVNSPAKRARSPLVNNNSINESTDQVNILCSTRIEPTRGHRKNAIKSSIGVHVMMRADLTEIINDDDTGQDSLPISKRKRNSNDIDNSTITTNS